MGGLALRQGDYSSGGVRPHTYPSCIWETQCVACDRDRTVTDEARRSPIRVGARSLREKFLLLKPSLSELCVSLSVKHRHSGECQPRLPTQVRSLQLVSSRWQEIFVSRSKFPTKFPCKLLWTGVEILKEAWMPLFKSLLLAASVITLSVAAHAQTVAAPAPATITLSPNNCGTPDTPKPCHFAKRMHGPKAVHQTSATTPPK
jgi:hypothetical protein